MGPHPMTSWQVSGLLVGSFIVSVLVIVAFEAFLDRLKPTTRLAFLEAIKVFAFVCTLVVILLGAVASILWVFA